jgi:tungstate transport system substrate-binding protein
MSGARYWELKELMFRNVVIFLAAIAAMSSLAEETVLRLATTTSTYETGLLDLILPPFEKEQGVKVHVISVGTGKAIKIAENGDVDAILVHARKAEDKFIEDGYGVRRRDVMHNDFIILGPKSDPAGVAGMTNVKKAMSKLASEGKVFVSRGDDSGTHKKEKDLWAEAGVNPAGAWYLESGQGMSATLRMADEKNAYVLVDRATYLNFKDKLRLEIAVEGDESLFNPYGIIAVNPEKHSHVKHDAATKLIEWITSTQCQRMIASFKKAGTQLFHPDAMPEPKEAK